MFSGGLDSACAYPILGGPDALYFGGKHGPARMANAGEVRAVYAMKKMLGDQDNIGAFEFDFRPFMRKVEVDGERGTEWKMPRHQICAMLANGMGYDKVLFAWCKEDGTSPEARDAFKKMFEGATGNRVEVDFPVLHLSKAELITRALDAGAKPEFLLASWSCVARSDRHCGKCVNCKQRRQAFINAGLPEPEGTYL